MTRGTYKFEDNDDSDIFRMSVARKIQKCMRDLKIAVYGKRQKNSFVIKSKSLTVKY